MASLQCGKNLSFSGITENLPLAAGTCRTDFWRTINVARLIATTILCACALLHSPLWAQINVGFDGSKHLPEKQIAAIQPIVDRFFPVDLMNPARPDNRRNCFGVYDRAADGTPLTIFAVYPETFHGVDGRMVEIHRQSSRGYTATDIGPSKFGFSGVYCSVEFVDIYQDDRDEVMVSVEGIDPGKASFLFQWNGTQLTSIGPTVQPWEHVLPAFSNVWFAKLYDDEALSAVSLDDVSREAGAPVTTLIYRLQDNKYKLAAHSTFTFFFGCGPHSCEQTNMPFSLEPSSVGPYVLRIGNGDLQGKNRVTAATVLINGVEVANSANVNEQVSVFTTALENVLKKNEHH